MAARALVPRRLLNQMTEDVIPGFDPDEFSSEVRSAFVTTKRAWSLLQPDICRRVMTEDLWAQQKARMQAVQLDGATNVISGLMISQLDIVDRSSTGLEDDVTVRMIVAGTDYILDRATNRLVTGSRYPGQWVEQWVMHRSRDPRVLAEALNPRCPNCGAPISIDEGGHCGFCRAAVPGAKSDWLASSIDHPAAADTTGIAGAIAVGIAGASADVEQARSALTGVPAAAPALAEPLARAGIAAIQAHDPDFSVGDIVAETREIFLGLEGARNLLDPTPVRAYLSDALWAAEVARADAVQATGQKHVRAFLDIRNIVIARANSDAGGDSLSIRVDAVSADHVVDVVTGRLLSGGDGLEPWSENLILVRGLGLASNPLRGGEAHQCPACGAPANVAADGRCASCGRHVTGGEFDWILWSIETPPAAAQPAG